MVHQSFKRAYLVDLREKIVDAVLRRGTSEEEAAGIPSGVGVSSGRRYVKVKVKGSVAGFRDGTGRVKGSSVGAG
jgi:transposase